MRETSSDRGDALALPASVDEPAIGEPARQQIGELPRDRLETQSRVLSTSKGLRSSPLTTRDRRPACIKRALFRNASAGRSTATRPREAFRSGEISPPSQPGNVCPRYRRRSIVVERLTPSQPRQPTEPMADRSYNSRAARSKPWIYNAERADVGDDEFPAGAPIDRALPTGLRWLRASKTLCQSCPSHASHTAGPVHS